MNKTTLILLQALGALTLLPYPAVLVANVMSIAAPKQNLFGALPFLALSFYPLVWIVLYLIAWRAMSRGNLMLAFGLSSIPALTGALFIAFVTYSTLTISGGKLNPNSPEQRKAIEQNPLLWSLHSTRGDLRYPPVPVVPAAEALRMIESNKDKVNLSVAPYGSPLKVAVENLGTRWDCTRDPKVAPLVPLVSALVKQGAVFAPAERNDINLHWKLRCALHEGPVNTASENPLVWRILEFKRDGFKVLQLSDEEKLLVNKETKLHGTPLYAALLRQAPELYPELINAGAKLSATEAAEPAVAAALEKALREEYTLKKRYEQQP